MPNRIIKESICTSDTIAELSFLEEAVFMRLIVLADDYGAFDGRPAIIKGKGFPLKDITAKQISDALRKLATVGMIYLYEVDGKPYLQLKTWEKHQRVRNSQHKYPTFEESDELRGELPQVAASDGLYPNPNPESLSSCTTTTTPRGRARGLDSESEEKYDPPLMAEVLVYFSQELCIDNAAKEAEKFGAYNAKRGWDCLPDWKAAADLWAARIDDKA